MAEISKSVLSRTVGDEEVLLDLKTQNYYGLNPTGTRIWNLVKQGYAAPRAARTISEEFEVPMDRAQSDVDGFIRTLRDKGLLRS